ncbi:MAG: ATP-binding protein [Paludibacteraceae bacterium]|nr:ATP-binding protein [Paludibacteraceae bacterium]
MRIAFIGPESCGKSTLSQMVAAHFQIPYIAEYARTYVERLTRPYVYRDVSAIAHRQIEELRDNPHAVFDTELILTQVWMHRCYGREPWWVEKARKQYPIDYYFVCAPDLPWQADPTRENPDCREELFRIYLSRVQKTGIPYRIIRGTDAADRLEQVLTVFENKVNGIGLLPLTIENNGNGQ